MNRVSRTALTNQLKLRIAELQSQNCRLKELLQGQGLNYQMLVQKEQKSVRKEDKSDLEKDSLNNIANEYVNNTLLKIQRESNLERYSRKCQELNNELDMLIQQEQKMALELEKMNVFEQDEIEENPHGEAKMKINLEELRKRKANLEDNLKFSQRKYQQISAQQNNHYSYNYEQKIIFNPAYDSTSSLRQVLKAFIEALHSSLVENVKIKVQKQELNVSHCQEIAQLKDQFLRKSSEYEQQISQLKHKFQAALECIKKNAKASFKQKQQKSREFKKFIRDQLQVYSQIKKQLRQIKRSYSG